MIIICYTNTNNTNLRFEISHSFLANKKKHNSLKQIFPICLHSEQPLNNDIYFSHPNTSTSIVHKHSFQIVGTGNYDTAYNLTVTYTIDTTTICHRSPNFDSIHMPCIQLSFSDSTLHFYTTTQQKFSKCCPIT